ncbi:MAG: hypothetical protein Q7S50_00915 [bacterium]|nr:hypothetical protein [bacterium]
MSGKVSQATRNINWERDMTHVLRSVAIAVLACFLGATTASAQTTTLSHNWSGELVQLKEMGTCGPYFNDAGSHAFFSLTRRSIEGETVRPVFVMSKRNITLIADDAQTVPYAWLSFNLATGRPVVTIKASTLDIQKAKCLSVIKTE